MYTFPILLGSDPMSDNYSYGTWYNIASNKSKEEINTAFKKSLEKAAHIDFDFLEICCNDRYLTKKQINKLYQLGIIIKDVLSECPQGYDVQNSNGQPIDRFNYLFLLFAFVKLSLEDLYWAIEPIKERVFEEFELAHGLESFD